jgi:hypothetical protein
LWIEKDEMGTLKKDIVEIERMLKVLIKSLEKKPSNLCPRQASLGPSYPTKLEKNHKWETDYVYRYRGNQKNKTKV